MHVTAEMAFSQELGEDELLQQGREEIDRFAMADESIHQLARHDDVSEAESGEEHAAEGSEVDHARRRVHPLQRAEGTAGVAILAVVVVLDDPGAAATASIAT